jgi:hypothetical protein
MDVVGIEVAVGIAVVLAIAWVGFSIHLRLLQRAVESQLSIRRAGLAAQRAEVGASGPAAVSPWPTSLSPRLRSSNRQRLPGVPTAHAASAENEEIATLIAEAEGITAYGDHRPERQVERSEVLKSR